MPTTTQITDILFKKYFGLGDTQSGRKYYEEPITGRPFVSPAQIWTDAQSIPYVAPGTTIGVVAYISGYPLTQVVGTSNSFTGLLFSQVIPFDYGNGTSYNYTISDSSGNSIPFGTNDWTVDTDAGILMFNSGIPLNLPPIVSFYRYSGRIGFSSFVTTGQTGGFGGGGGSATGNYVPISGGNAIVTGNIIIGVNAGVYTFSKTIAPNTAQNIAYISSYYGTQVFNLGVNIAQSGFCVGKMFSVVAPYSGSTIVNMNVNSGPYNGNDFQANLSVSGNSGVLLNITNFGSITGTFVSTIFLCGGNNQVTIVQY